MKYLIVQILLFPILICQLFSQENMKVISLYNLKTDNSIWYANKNNFGKNNLENELSFTLKEKFSWGQININISNAYENKNQIKSGESFLKFDFKNKSYLKIGQYYRDFSLYLDDNLSTGSILISKNAAPFKKIGFILNKDILGYNFDFGISHGQLRKNTIYSKAPYVHGKFIYMDIIDTQDQLFTIGLVHQALWAGGTYELGNFPSDFESFLKVFISADGPVDSTRPTSHPNALGSHLGIWDFSFTKKLANQNELLVYYQHIFEDTSSFRFANEIDGLWGIQFTNLKNQSKFLVEYLDTTHSDLDPPYQADTYYWNYQYQDGWKYFKNIIGNPFINPNSGEKGVWGHQQLKVLHLASEIKLLESLNLRSKATKVIGKESNKYVATTNEMLFSLQLIKDYKKVSLFLDAFGEGENIVVGIGLQYKFN